MQYKQFGSHLTGLREIKFLLAHKSNYSSIQKFPVLKVLSKYKQNAIQMRHVEIVYLVKTKSTVLARQCNVGVV